MAKPDKATLKSEGEALKSVIAQARKKTLNFALLQGKDTMYLETHLKKNTAMLRKEAKKKGGGPKAAMGQMNVEGKKIIFSVEEEPPGPFPKLAKKFFMIRGLPMLVAFKLPNGSMLEDAEGQGSAAPASPPAATPDDQAAATGPSEKTKAKYTKLESVVAAMMPMLSPSEKSAMALLLDQVRADVESGDASKAEEALKELQTVLIAEKAKQEKNKKTLIAAAAALKETNISVAQKEALLKIAIERPEAFNASLKALKAIDKGLNPLNCSPKGLAKAQKAAEEEKAKLDVLTEAAKQAQAQFDAAKTAATTAATNVETAAGKTAKLLSSLTKIKAAVAKMNPEQRAAMTPEQKQAIADLKAKLDRAKAAEKAAKAALNQTEAHRDKLEGKKNAIGQKVGQSKTNLDAATKTLKATKKGVADKKQLTDAMTNGVLSPDAPNPMSDTDAASIANAYTVDADFGATALNLVRTTDDRTNILDGVTRLTKGAQNEFKDSAGNSYGNSKARGAYAANALTTGANVGGEYFKNMDAYISAGGLNKPTPVPSPSPATWKTLAAARAKHLGNAMMAPNGQIDAESAKAKTAVADISFHPGVLYNSQPDLIKHANEMSASMAKPSNKAKCQAALDGITTPPTSDVAQGLVAKDVGKAAGDLTKDDVKQAVMTSMFTPLKQGPVGSCFATGPARALRAKDPGRVMEDMAQIAVKGTFTPKDSTVPIKAVRNSTDEKLNKLPPDDNQLMRSWEYTIATAAAQLTDSRQRGRLSQSLFSDPNSMEGIAKLYPNDKWKDVRTKLEAAVKSGLKFRYNSTSKIEPSKDGSSISGNYEIVDKNGAGEAAILSSKEKFVAAITRIALAAIPEGKDTDIGKKIIAHCKSDAFIDAICPEKYKPWELSGGGFDDAVIKILDGGTPSFSSLTPNQNQSLSDGPRTTQITVGLIKCFDGVGADQGMTDITVNGIHTFNGLPNDPSLDKLKGGDTDAKVYEHLNLPGQKIAATKLKLPKAVMIFEKQVRSAEGWQLGEEGAALIEVALGLKPTAEMTPKALKELVETVMEPLKELSSNMRFSKWKEQQIADGKTLSDEALAKNKKDFDDSEDEDVSNNFDNEIIVQTAPPQFTIADTNWGDERMHTYFVIIADPVSGDPKLFKKDQPSGRLTAMDPEWIQAGWKEVK